MKLQQDAEVFVEPSIVPGQLLLEVVRMSSDGVPAFTTVRLTPAQAVSLAIQLQRTATRLDEKRRAKVALAVGK